MKRLSFPMALLLFAGYGIALAADDLETTFQNLKEADSKKDAAQVKKLAVDAIGLALKAASEPAPTAEDEKATWKSQVEYYHSIETFAEYALLGAALASPPETTIDLISTLEQQSPKSKYLDQGYSAYFVALNKTGAAAKIPDIAEKALKNFPDNEDLLLVLTENARSKNQTDRALTYATRLVSVLIKHPKPENVPAADWEKKKSVSLAEGYWVSGVIYGEKNRYVEADKNLRAALPLIAGNEAMLGPAYFYLGLANYQLGKMTLNKARILEGAKFSDQCAAIKGPLATQAWKNSAIMKDEAGKMR